MEFELNRMKRDDDIDVSVVVYQLVLFLVVPFENADGTYPLAFELSFPLPPTRLAAAAAAKLFRRRPAGTPTLDVVEIPVV